MRLVIRLVGIGGQGVVTAGLLLARGFFQENYEVYQTQSYGSASRGSISRTDLIVQTSKIMDLTIDTPTHLVLLSKDAVTTYFNLIPTTQVTIIDNILWDQIDQKFRITDANVHWIPASKIALEEFGRPQALNMIALGYLVNQLERPSIETMLNLIKKQWPAFAEENTKAFKRGYELERTLISAQN